ncbi:group II intron maturase-specific domain-containing protein [Nocardia amamiensis]|uniref:group II intron maturase-specific domain-containing protein n=1 Tax=Nocardia amamiensis TaxID=404578 RepID=UPI002B4AF39B|nr:group II intron maturase-specific domain-containing protein [Nocardia amamiensis]
MYCKDRKRRLDCENTSFTFLGYTFRARKAPTRDGLRVFSAFLPAVGTEALKAKGAEIRGWRLHRRTTKDLAELAAWINPIVRGWMTYYGKFYRSGLYVLLRRINTYLVRWARRKFKRLRSSKKARQWWNGLLQRQPRLFAHWAWMTAF